MCKYITLLPCDWLRNSKQPPVPTYKQRLEDFKKLFKELPETERLLVDYPCALQRDILLQGRIYLSVNWVCFYSNVFRGTKITLTLKNITNMTREKTARFIPNAIQICTSTDKFFFTSFSAREKSYREFSRMWENTLLGKVRPCFTHLLLPATAHCPNRYSTRVYVQH
uniref:GRAM domain-containing protein n=1 Tax=Pundamilia nyererei TaxID=303518 RepID=A0A3B4F5X5_9CICH